MKHVVTGSAALVAVGAIGLGGAVFNGQKDAAATGTNLNDGSSLVDRTAPHATLSPEEAAQFQRARETVQTLAAQNAAVAEKNVQLWGEIANGMSATSARLNAQTGRLGMAQQFEGLNAERVNFKAQVSGKMSLEEADLVFSREVLHSLIDGIDSTKLPEAQRAECEQAKAAAHQFVDTFQVGDPCTQAITDGIINLCRNPYTVPEHLLNQPPQKGPGLQRPGLPNLNTPQGADGLTQEVLSYTVEGLVELLGTPEVKFVWSRIGIFLGVLAPSELGDGTIAADLPRRLEAQRLECQKRWERHIENGGSPNVDFTKEPSPMGLTKAGSEPNSTGPMKEKTAPKEKAPKAKEAKPAPREPVIEPERELKVTP